MPHFMFITLAAVLIGAGMIVFPLPIPLGAPMVAVGVTMLITHSRTAARAMTALRLRWQRFNRAIQFLEQKAPRVISRSLRRTRPEGVRYFGRRP